MLSIEFCDVIEEIAIGDLFDDLNFVATINTSDDSFIKNEWSIETQSYGAFYPVEGFRWTKPEDVVKLTHGNIQNNDVQELFSSPEHIVLTEKRSWQKVCDLQYDDQIMTSTGLRCLIDVSSTMRFEHLCDMQVSISHSYYTNGVLSHNSHFLTDRGCAALLKKKNVVHYTLEMLEPAVGIRYDSNLCDIDSLDVIESKEKILANYAEMSMGRLIIKHYPPRAASVHTLRAHLERAALKGFRPDLLIIDYADLLRSSRQFDSLRHELQLVYEELRALAIEFNVPIWTASQSNKEGSTSEVIDLTNMSEAYGKAMTADVVLSISRLMHEKALGVGRLFVAKNRAGRDGIVYPISIDTARSKFAIRGEQQLPEDAKSEDANSIKRTLQKKWQELKKDTSLTVSDVVKSKTPQGDD